MTLTTRSYRPATSLEVAERVRDPRMAASGAGDAEHLLTQIDGEDLVILLGQQHGHPTRPATQVEGGRAVAPDEDAPEPGGEKAAIQLVTAVIAGGENIE